MLSAVKGKATQDLLWATQAGYSLSEKFVYLLTMTYFFLKRSHLQDNYEYSYPPSKDPLTERVGIDGSVKAHLVLLAFFVARYLNKMTLSYA